MVGGVRFVAASLARSPRSGLHGTAGLVADGPTIRRGERADVCHSLGMASTAGCAGRRRPPALARAHRWTARRAGARAPNARTPGIFAVETTRPSDGAPTDIVAIRGWLERVPSLRLDGERPTPTAARQAPVASSGSPASGCCTSAAATSRSARGSRRSTRPSSAIAGRTPGGHWLKALRELSSLVIWWAETDAAEEYEDALLTAFSRGRPRGGPRRAPPPGSAAALGEPREPVGRAPRDRPHRVPPRERHRARAGRGADGRASDAQAGRRRGVPLPHEPAASRSGRRRPRRGRAGGSQQAGGGHRRT